MRIVAVLGLLVFQTACAAEPQVIQQAPVAYVKGDQWLFHRKDLIENRAALDLNYQVTEVNMAQAWVYVWSNSSKSWTLYDNQRGQNIELRSFDVSYENRRGRVLRSYSSDPETSIVQFPLSVGREYKIRDSILNAAGEISAAIKLSARVDAYEKIKIAAGEYEAYKIVAKGYMRIYSSGLDEDVEDTYWWAPAAKRVVLSEHKQWSNAGKLYVDQSVELATYIPGQP